VLVTDKLKSYAVANVFPRRRDHDTAAKLRSGRTQAFATWADVTGVVMAA
jgi:hypothetical protein